MVSLALTLTALPFPVTVIMDRPNLCLLYKTKADIRRSVRHAVIKHNWPYPPRYFFSTNAPSTYWCTIEASKD